MAKARPKKEPRLKTVGYPVGVHRSNIAVHKPETRSQQVRIRGRALQEKRKAFWIDNPHCEKCNAFTLYPHGFELDHRIRLADGGDESPENTQLLCIACHADKTESEGGR